MVISAIIITLMFVTVIGLVLTDKMNRAIAALGGAIVTFFVLTYIDGVSFISFMGFLFGTQGDSFVNLHSLILILGMMFLVQVCNEAGVFQYYAFVLVQHTKGNPRYLLLIICALSVGLSAILNNILTVIILIPLIITVSRILSINPTPYIITSAILVNIGGMVFPISSIPNILITSYANITFLEFFFNVGLISLLVFGISLLFFHIIFKDRLDVPQERLVKVLEDFNAWNFVPDKRVFSISRWTLLFVLVGIFTLEPVGIEPSMIALTGGILLTIITRLNAKEILEKIDFELLLYLLGIFVLSGALELVGIINFIGAGLSYLTGGNVFVTIMIIMWFSAFLSSTIDNIPITKVLIPIVGVIGTNFTVAQVKEFYYGLAFGANLGDNLTPMGDNILVMKIAEANERPISTSTFFKLGFLTTIIQLFALTIYYALYMVPIFGILLLILVGIGILSIYLFNYFEKKYGKIEFSRYYKIKQRILKILKKIGDKIGIKKHRKN
ncbi:MAG: hypothetical protein EAX96_11445 [Candidatus Lokiarchaeota archaeon]|nr:hypothetical protein [Candidatus Lokiarchaeota archaeon]